MSNGLDRSSWKSGVAGASSRLATLKGLIPPPQRDALRTFFDRRSPSARTPEGSASREGQDHKVSWREWAGDKLRSRNPGNTAVEKVSLFPGWAARRYYDEGSVGKEAAEFSIEVYVSGFAASYVPSDLATRSQRAFMRLAKAYASLPKLPTTGSQTPPSGTITPRLSNSTEDLLKNVVLPPRPTEITEESELAALERQFKKAEEDVNLGSDSSSLHSVGPDSLRSYDMSQGYAFQSAAQGPYIPTESQFNVDSVELTRLHDNLNSRLQPFWSRALSNRMIRVSIFSHPPKLNVGPFEQHGADTDPMHYPIHVEELLTDSQGAFETRLKISWTQICQHAGALHIAFGSMQDTDLYVCVDLIPSGPRPLSTVSSMEYAARSVIPVSLNYTKVRLISDIDDTIKFSNILGGVRTVFRNVFVKHLEELVVKGMGDWYTTMWSKGVRFHYVSNSPFELLPVINEFIKISCLPQGSVKLRNYAGRSLFNGLISSPSSRKRDGIVDILNAFSGSQFFLVGDSGEQDLELYSQIASERSNQILAIFIRDVSGPSSRPIDDPTGEKIKELIRNQSQPIFNSSEENQNTLGVGEQFSQISQIRIRKQRSETTGGFYPGQFNHGIPHDRYGYVASTHSPITGRNLETRSRSYSTPTPFVGPSLSSLDSDLAYSELPHGSDTAPPDSDLAHLFLFGGLSKADVSNLDQGERRRYELQERVYRARMLIPSHIVLRVFSFPEDCVEADQILDKKFHPSE